MKPSHLIATLIATGTIASAGAQVQCDRAIHIAHAEQDIRAAGAGILVETSTQANWGIEPATQKRRLAEFMQAAEYLLDKCPVARWEDVSEAFRNREVALTTHAVLAAVQARKSRK